MTDLREKGEAELAKYHIGCNLKVECNSECTKCAAKAIIPLIREEALKEVRGQIWKSSYINPNNKIKVINGIEQALKSKYL